ncbi:MAG: hypothetical protein R3F62_09195 [Planctomycetota bacterium]
MRRARFLAGAGLLFLLGCPGPDPEPGPDGTAPVESDATPEPATPADPLEGSLFSKEQLFEIYRAEHQGGAERTRVLRAHKLLDAEGSENRRRIEAYEDAIGRYAQGDPEGWADFVQSLAD